MPVERQIMDDEPLMIAWKAYKNTEDFRNTAKWATQAEHLMGSLWAVFVAGYESRTPPISYDAAVEKVALVLADICGDYEAVMEHPTKSREFQSFLKHSAHKTLIAMGISEGR